uniref:Ion_trans_2 domain-containing protein n=1 Tax=Panagrellus redivivus TaxID=6233 RepID=A0A7E4VTZ7_PANRE
MAVFFKRSRENGSIPNRVRSPSSPLNTTYLAEGYTDDGQLSRYENVRPHSRFSFASTLNSRTHISQVSAVNVDDASTASQMIHFGGTNAADYVEAPTHSFGPPPKGRLPKLKYYYDKYRLRHFAPIILLILYSLMGALLFYVLEHDHEQELFRKEKLMLDKLRNSTLRQLREVMTNRRNSEDTRLYASKDILVWYEQELKKTKLPEALEWDMWGALFYVGTVFTTIGYGNITPRTTNGQAISIAYAIVGIPLVLAILSQCGKALTNWASDSWIRYRMYIKKHRRLEKLKILRRRRGTVATNGTADSTATNSVHNLHALEEGRSSRAQPIDECSINTATLETPNQRLVDPLRLGHQLMLEDEEEDMESRTIPIWLALLMCIGWICGCAGLFLIWETRWSYFTSLYFFCISLSTIGLGDVVPDHPRMLILMFWLVIMGLSIVSMLLSVIQIKMEEWLYHLMIRMQKEYRQALESGDPKQREEILSRLLDNEPWYLREMAPHFISDEQADKLNTQAEVFERVTCEMNNKNIQTGEDDIIPHASFDEHVVSETSFRSMPGIEVQTSHAANNKDAATSIMTNVRYQADAATSDSLEDIYHDLPPQTDLTTSAPVRASLRTAASADSISDATSLPMDPISYKNNVDADISIQHDLLSIADRSMQTDLAQFQIDEIALKLHELQSVPKPLLIDRSAETSLREATRVSTGVRTDSIAMDTKSAQISIGPETADKSQATEQASFVNRSMETKAQEVQNRSMETANVGLWRGECSRAIQTAFSQEENDTLSPDEEKLLAESAKSKRRRFSNRKNVYSFEDMYLNEISVQCDMGVEGADTVDTEMQTDKQQHSTEFSECGTPRWRRSDSIATNYTESVDYESRRRTQKQDLIIQTDDSYLKIARRLDEYRNNRTQSLHVCAAPPLQSSESLANLQRREMSDHPSERREYSVEPLRRKRSERRKSLLTTKSGKNGGPEGLSEPEEAERKTRKVAFDVNEPGPSK